MTPSLRQGPEEQAMNLPREFLRRVHVVPSLFVGRELCEKVRTSVIGLFLVPAAFVCVPWLEHLNEPNLQVLDLELPSLLFNGAALLTGGFSLFLAMKEPKLAGAGK
ncbi:hypothetical protein AB0323_07495 [Arthrobacter sp. NPDC080031]|uniref:hypothetical protein n=1 Tax=Arthrobacter sp. NPDC080031 TaxID=3155918 RepID=UPI00345060BD